MGKPKIRFVTLFCSYNLNDGLGIYNNAIAALVEKDAGWAKDINSDLESIRLNNGTT